MSLYQLWESQRALSVLVAALTLVVGAVGAASHWQPAATAGSVSVWALCAFLLYPRDAPERPTDG
jgi:hypothetical protein